MAGASYQPNSQGLGQVLNGPEVRAALRLIAEKAEGIAKGLAEDFRVTGEYEESFEITEGKSDDGKRPVLKLENTSDHAAAVEWGNEATHGRGHRVLGRTLDALKEG